MFDLSENIITAIAEVVDGVDFEADLESQNTGCNGCDGSCESGCTGDCQTYD